MAAGSSGAGTRSGMMACQVGPFMVAPSPSAKVSHNRVHGPVDPVRVIAPSTAAAASINPCVTSSSLRRSNRSPAAPAGTPKRNTGRLVAVCTSATSSADGASSVISQAAPTFCIQVPMLDTTAAIQSQRNQV